MRGAGEVVDAARLGVHDHLCWSYTDPADFRARAVEFLADGLRQGLRVGYVAAGREEQLLGHLSALPDLERHLGRGALQVTSLSATYRSGEAVVPEEQVRIYATATDEALAEGFAGLRVAAEATPLVVTRAQLDAFAAYEHLVDRYMARHPFSAMCAYRTVELPAGAAAELASMHPLARKGTVMFRLHGTDRADAALAGEVDMSVHELFKTALGRVDLAPTGGPVVIDGSGLSYIDHHGLMMLRDQARQAGATVVLRTPSPGPARLLELLDIDGITVEAA